MKAKKFKLAKLISIGAALLCLLILLLGLVRAVISPDYEIYYENRPAARFGAPELSSYMDGSYQDSVESALSDQINLAIKMKKLYNIIDIGFALPLAEALQDSTGAYTGLRDIYLYEDILVKKSTSLDEKQDALDRCSNILNRYQEALDAEVYVYYIETDMDMDFVSGRKSGVYEYLCSKLELPEENIDRLELGSFDEYRQNFLGTDHHWNGNGAYKAYQEICNMLGGTALEALGQHSIGGKYLGTRAAGLEGIKPEVFTVNIINYPAMDIYIDGELVPDYGMQQQFINNEMPSFSYGSVFGPDCAELVFDTGKPGKNLLVLGDSYDNAIAKALGASFARTHFVDLRHFDSASFDLVSYAEENEIDAVLFVGGLSYYCNTLY